MSTRRPVKAQMRGRSNRCAGRLSSLSPVRRGEGWGEGRETIERRLTVDHRLAPPPAPPRKREGGDGR